MSSEDYSKTTMRRRLILLLALAIFCGSAYIIRDYTTDDAFITFRYSENLVNGHGLVFNPGGKPVEGYSNFLWMLILAGVYAFGLPVVLSSKILGLAGMLLSGLLWYRRYEHDRSFLWLAGPLFLICPFTPFWGLSGLELGIYTFILSGAVISYLRRHWIAFVLLALLILGRPEGALVAFVLIMAAVIGDRKALREHWRFHLASTLVVIATLAALTIFRIVVFGYPLPNTYYAKLSRHWILGGIELARILILLAPLTAGFIWGIVRIIRKKFCEIDIIVFASVCGAQAFITIGVDPVMNFLMRYLIPFLPLLIILNLKVISGFRLQIVRVILLALIAPALVLPEGQVARAVIQGREIVASQDVALRWIKSLPTETVISMSDMGRIPYYTGRRFHDIYGLVKPDAARQSFQPRMELMRYPDYFLLVGHLRGESFQLRFWREQIIANNDAFAAGYALEGVFRPAGVDPQKPGYYYLAFGKRPRGAALMQEALRRIRDLPADSQK